MFRATLAVLVAGACAGTPDTPPLAPEKALERTLERTLDENADLRRALDRVDEGWEASKAFSETRERLRKVRSREGWVLGARDGRVRISLGRRNGYEAGDEFFVRRGQTSVGILVLDGVSDSRGEGRFRMQEAQARIGDEVVTRKLRVKEAAPKPGYDLEAALVAALETNVELKTALTKQWRGWEEEPWWHEIRRKDERE